MSSSMSRQSSRLAASERDQLSRSGSSQHMQPGHTPNMSSASMGGVGLASVFASKLASRGSSRGNLSAADRSHVTDAHAGDVDSHVDAHGAYSRNPSSTFRAGADKELPQASLHPRDAPLITPQPQHEDPHAMDDPHAEMGIPDALADQGLDVNAPQYDYDDLVEGVNEVQFGQRIDDAEDYMTESTDIDISKLSVGERLYYIGCGMERNKQERLRKERENKIVSELSAVTAKPMITPFARKLSSGEVDFAEKAMIWRKGLDRKRKAASARQVMMDQQENLNKVEMNSRSQAILEKGRIRTKYKGPIAGWNKHFARYQTKKNILPDREVFTPNINNYSSTLHRDGGVGERLFDEARKKEERLRRMMELAAMQEIVDPVTGCAYFTPRSQQARESVSVNRTHRDASCEPPASVERSERRDIDTVVSTLLAKGQEAQNRLKQTTNDTGFSFKPELNKKSEELVSAKGRKPLYDRSKFSNKQNVQAAQTPNKSPQYSTCTPSFIRRNERLLVTKQERVRNIKRQQEQREMEECTFTPRICMQSEEILAGGAIGIGGASTGARRSRSAEPVSSSASRGPAPAYGAPTRRSQDTDAVHAPPPPPPPPPPAKHGAPNDPYVSTFEKEMMSILEEWQKLEDV